ncbi:hypothetical protein B0O80DRAFT_442390 [Mortierella sp. GBAus27b]|nr:hypothetical protein B0O80DRAFT_442390 [Mortierella sp. GBAus27b]
MTAIANNSDEDEDLMRPRRRRASSGAGRHMNVLQPSHLHQLQLLQQQQQQQQQLQQPQPLQPQPNRLSIQSLQSLQSVRSRGRSESTSALMSPYQLNNRMPRPQSQHGMIGGFERGEMGGTASPLLRVQNQLSPKSRDRRRSFTLYPVNGAGAAAAAANNNVRHVQISPDEGPAGGLVQSEYFASHHHGAQSPLGMARGGGAASAMAMGTPRSCVNTPSRNGRASRISVGAGQPQTLARELEQRQPQQHAAFNKA